MNATKKLPFYVASQIEVYFAGEALNKLMQDNDARFAGAHGITRVDAARWQRAQEYERDTWLIHAREWDDDKNVAHAQKFDDYKALPDDLGDFIELGCGPFTNARIILEGRRAHTVTLLDPLMRDYLGLPNNGYQRLPTRGEPMAQLKAGTIEDFPTTQQYDTVVMINVLDHCRDADAVTQKVWDITRPGGWVVLFDEPREIDPAIHYDAGHPLALGAAYMEAWLARWEPVYRNGWHFIGRKPA